MKPRSALSLLAKRRTKRQIILDGNKWDQAMANLAGVPAKNQQAVPELKQRAPRVLSPKLSEQQILRAILQLLRTHPKVAKVWRQNSGTAIMGYGENQRYVRMNGARGMSDIMGLLKTGRTLCIEVKSSTGYVQPHQQEFLDSITRAGGLAFVARDTQTVIDKLAEA